MKPRKFKKHLDIVHDAHYAWCSLCMMLTITVAMSQVCRYSILPIYSNAIQNADSYRSRLASVWGGLSGYTQAWAYYWTNTARQHSRIHHHIILHTLLRDLHSGVGRPNLIMIATSDDGTVTVTRRKYHAGFMTSTAVTITSFRRWTRWLIECQVYSTMKHACIITRTLLN